MKIINSGQHYVVYCFHKLHFKASKVANIIKPSFRAFILILSNNRGRRSGTYTLRKFLLLLGYDMGRIYSRISNIKIIIGI